MRKMSDKDAELVFRQLRKCKSDAEFRGIINSLKSGNIAIPETYDEYVKRIQCNAVNDTKSDSRYKPSIIEAVKYRIINDKHISDDDKINQLNKVDYFKENAVNIMLLGPVGSGKSATVNAILQNDMAKVGNGIYPETKYIKKYRHGGLTIWDTPGLGNDRYIDKCIIKDISNILEKRNNNDRPLIDAVVIVLNSVSSDYMVMSEIFNNILMSYVKNNAEPSYKIPHSILSKEMIINNISSKIIIALNQCDIMMHRDYWERWNSNAYKELRLYMKEKEDYVKSVARKLICRDILHMIAKDGSRIDIKAVCYSAGYKEDGMEQNASYNVDTLMWEIIDNYCKKKIT